MRAYDKPGDQDGVSLPRLLDEKASQHLAAER
jgi:hypothetical protein